MDKPSKIARGRSPISALPGPALQRIQTATMKYTWAGVTCSKDPFDLALYPMLIWNQKPGTIIEIGSKAGGSALWMSDLCYRFRLDTKIISVDINQRATIRRKNVEFLWGDGRNLGPALSDAFMTGLPRPLLVIEDADHHYLTTLAVLQFMSRWLRDGEYIVIEDGIGASLPHSRTETHFDGGPNRAIAEFLDSPEGAAFEVDPEYCDFFGHNVTWNTNGYLRRRPA